MTLIWRRDILGRRGRLMKTEVGTVSLPDLTLGTGIASTRNDSDVNMTA